jgi:hypothetical protein
MQHIPQWCVKQFKADRKRKARGNERERAAKMTQSAKSSQKRDQEERNNPPPRSVDGYSMKQSAIKSGKFAQRNERKMVYHHGYLLKRRSLLRSFHQGNQVIVRLCLSFIIKDIL